MEQENKPTVDKEATLGNIPLDEEGHREFFTKKEVYSAMDEYAASLLKERDELKDLIQEQSNEWAAKAIERQDTITALQSSNEAKEKRIEELTEALTTTEKGYEIFRDKSEKQKQEIERLKGLIELGIKLAQATSNLIQDIKNKPNDTRYATHTKAALSALESWLNKTEHNL